MAHSNNSAPRKVQRDRQRYRPSPFCYSVHWDAFRQSDLLGHKSVRDTRGSGSKKSRSRTKRCLICGFFKLLIPFFNVAGIIAFHLYGDSLGSMDQAYPRLIKDVLPPCLMGFFLAVLLGTVFSSFNSLLQSTATLVTYDLIVPNMSKPLADETLVKMRPLRLHRHYSNRSGDRSFVTGARTVYWQVIRKIFGVLQYTDCRNCLSGLFIRSASPVGAISVIIFHLIVYGLITFVVDTGIHFIHWYGILFILEMIIILLVRGPKEPIAIENPAVDMTPWRYRWAFCSMLGVAIIVLYVVLSPVGLASVEANPSSQSIFL